MRPHPHAFPGSPSVPQARYPAVADESKGESALAVVAPKDSVAIGSGSARSAGSNFRKIENRDVLLLAGIDAQDYQESTTKLSKCFTGTNRIAGKTDLSPSGFGIINASMEQSEAYDQRLIDFFRASLSN